MKPSLTPAVYTDLQYADLLQHLSSVALIPYLIILYFMWYAYIFHYHTLFAFSQVLYLLFYIDDIT